MKKTKSILFSGILFLVAVFLVVVSAQFGVKPGYVGAEDTPPTPPAVTPKKVKLTGYAWSENIGWISFKEVFLGGDSKSVYVREDGTLGGLTSAEPGYAWSENIGWIQFGGLSGFPSGTGASTDGNAKITNGKVLKGWVRAVAGMSTVNTGGWDGWISLNGTAGGSPYQVTLRAGSSTVVTASDFAPPACDNGCAWGSEVVGWVDFSGVNTMEIGDSCVDSEGNTIPDGSGLLYSKTTGDVCETEFRTCNNGTLEGDPTYNESGSACDIPPPKPCLREGKTFPHGTELTRYSKAIVGKTQTCESFKSVLVCDDGDFYDKATGQIDTGTHKILKCIGNPNVQEL